MLIVSNADPNHYPELADANVNSGRVIALDIMGFDCDFLLYFGGLLASCWPTPVSEGIVGKGEYLL